jgi:curved DNA-binding protein CbpA
LAKLKDYYEVLGIPHRAHVRVIEESYWEQAHELKKQPTRKAAKRLSAINEAYETLGTPHRRLKYDRELGEYSGSNGHSDQQGGFLASVISLLGRPFRPD